MLWPGAPRGACSDGRRSPSREKPEWPIPPCRPRLRPRNKQEHWPSGCDWAHFAEMETEARGGQGTCWREKSRADSSLTRLHAPPVSQGLRGQGEKVRNACPVSPPEAARERARARGCRGQRPVAPSTTSRQAASATPGEQRLSCGTLVRGTSLSLHLPSTDRQKPPEKADALACQGPGAGKVPTPSFSQGPGCSSGHGRL